MLHVLTHSFPTRRSSELGLVEREERAQVAAAGLGDAAVAVERDRVAAETGHLRAERRHLGGAEEAGEEEEAVAAVIFKLTARQRALGLLASAVPKRVHPGPPLAPPAHAGGNGAPPRPPRLRHR